jgi:hypothetical protein
MGKKQVYDLSQDHTPSKLGGSEENNGNFSHAVGALDKLRIGYILNIFQACLR